jgi:hypothetical protein
VQGLEVEVLVYVVVHVLVAEAACRASSALVAPVVVMVGDVQVTKVFLSVRIAVAHKG